MAQKRGRADLSAAIPSTPVNVLVSLNVPLNERSFANDFVLVKVGDAASPARRFDQVTRRAGTLVSSLVGDDTGIGIAWGVTLSLVARHLEPRRLGGVRVVQLNGSAHAGDTAIPYVGSILQTIADRRQKINTYDDKDTYHIAIMRIGRLCHSLHRGMFV